MGSKDKEDCSWYSCCRGGGAWKVRVDSGRWGTANSLLVTALLERKRFARYCE